MSRTEDWSRLSDEQLIVRWRQDGGGQAVDVLLGRYRMRVYRWCRSFVGDHETALDLAQDTLLKAYQDIGNLRNESGFASWLFVIVRHRCLDELKKRRVRGTDDIDPDSLAAQGSDPAEAWLQQVAYDQLCEAMTTSLSPLEKDALSLRCFEKMPVDTITATLHIAAATGARGVLQTARRKLKTALGRGED